MTVLERIKIFIDEKILKKDAQKLLLAPTDTYEMINQQINLTNIHNYIMQDKYKKSLNVMFSRLKPYTKRNLMAKLQTEQEMEITATHDEVPLAEGYISGKEFIVLNKRNVPEDKIWQTIVTDTSCVDISTRKKLKDNNYTSVYYKGHFKKDLFDEIYEFDEDNEYYYRRIRNENTIYFESAGYPSAERIAYIEDFAQPSNEKMAIAEYTKQTKLKYISSDEDHNITNVLKVNPYVVTIEASIVNKDGQEITRKTLRKVYKSKKECIVGYRPEMVLIEGKSMQTRMFRLLPEGGEYIDNESFKADFEGKYTFKKVPLNEIEDLVKEIPFGLSEDTKKILRNGINIPDHIKTIYKVGFDQIKNKKG